MPVATDLKIAVIGAGMGGLATALGFAKKGFKNIEVYEAAPNLGFVGAGIQLAPNMARVLDRWGCWDEILAEATDIRSSSIRDGVTGKEAVLIQMPGIEDKYGYPHCVGHRASLAGSMYKACKNEESIRFYFSTPLVEILSFGRKGGPENGKTRFVVQPRDGDSREVEADLLVGADGIKSAVRSSLLRATGGQDRVMDTGQAAYRIMLPRARLEHDPEMMDLLNADCALRWIGDKRHIIAYPISNKTIYNISTCQPDINFSAAAPGATYMTQGSKKTMLRVYADFCPLVQRMLDLVPEGEVCEWKLRSHKPLDSWSLGRVGLLGDACHPALPHLGQGASMAIEDGAVLAEAISRIPETDLALSVSGSISQALKVYELLRKGRTSTLVHLADFSGRSLQLGEKRAMKERDRHFEQAKRKGRTVPDKWVSPDTQKMLYAHDCVEVAERRFEQLYAEVGAFVNGLDPAHAA